MSEKSIVDGGKNSHIQADLYRGFVQWNLDVVDCSFYGLIIEDYISVRVVTEKI